MELNEILTIDCVKVPLEHVEKHGAIDELVDLLAKVHDLNDAKAIRDAVWEREKTRTTGIGQGLAIPHCKSSACGDQLLMAIGKPETPIEFDSIDKKPVQLIILLASPPDRTSEHIQVLAQVSRLMLNEEFRNTAYRADNAEELFELFTQPQTTQI